MKIAVILPYLHKIEGNKTSISLISQFINDGNVVTLFSWKITEPIYNKLKNDIPELNIKYKHLINGGKFGVLFAVKYQLLKKVDKNIVKMIENDHKINGIDLVIVPSNEGKWIGEFIKKFSMKSRPLTMLTVMELHENGMFIPQRSITKKIASFFFYPLFFILQQFEKKRMEAFDIITSNSKWTEQLLSYFYGINSKLEMIFFDNNLFKFQEKPPIITEKYIAVSTVSITNEHRKIIEKLISDGINIIAFGSRKVKSENYEGFVSDERLREILTNASGTLFLFDYEAFGLIPLESLISGTPVITEPKMGVYTEYHDCVDVHFVQSYEDILNSCRNLLNTQKTQDIRIRCKNWANKYDPSNVVNKIMEEYKKLRTDLP
ncbi:MAG: glycosyltransferase [Thermoplasmataceae archaeon]